MNCFVHLLLVELLSFNLVFGSEYFVVLTSNSPTVRGGTIHLVANLYDEDGESPTGSFKYEWEDNAIHTHTATHESKIAKDTWNVTYPANDFFPPGPYVVQVTVLKSYLFLYIPITSQRTTIKLTENLNGKIELEQKHKTIEHFISNKETVLHRVRLNASDEEYINKTATSVYTYWFVDCVYFGFTTDYTFSLNYTDVDKKHKVEAIVVADFTPITTPAPSTTTPMPNITITPNDTTSLTKPTRNLELEHNASLKNSLVISEPVNVSLPYVCLNNGTNNTSPPDPNKTYGYFAKHFIVKAPVSNISITGNYWVNKGDVLHLMVKCQGSPQFSYCKHIFEGVYNVTGNEACDVPTPDTSDQCEFLIERYLRKPQKYTIAIVIYNEVGKIVSPVTVTVYEVSKQAQISVIVVPVASSILAVVLIIFGVAYYVQNRTRFIIEVADFNFGQQFSDLEYKTFWERVHDSISTALFRAPTPHSSEPNLWPPGRKYGSLT